MANICAVTPPIGMASSAMALSPRHLNHRELRPATSSQHRALGADVDVGKRCLVVVNAKSGKNGHLKQRQYDQRVNTYTKPKQHTETRNNKSLFEVALL